MLFLAPKSESRALPWQLVTITNIPIYRISNFVVEDQFLQVECAISLHTVLAGAAEVNLSGCVLNFLACETISFNSDAGTK